MRLFGRFPNGDLGNSSLVRVYPVPVNWTVAPFRVYPPLPSCSTELGRISRWMATPAASINTANVRKIRKILHTSLAEMICLSSVRDTARVQEADAYAVSASTQQNTSTRRGRSRMRASDMTSR